MSATRSGEIVVKERAQGLVEYGLIIALVALLAIAGLVLLGPLLSSMFSSMTSSV
jgi:Flp pilus assembly pilin Flp